MPRMPLGNDYNQQLAGLTDSWPTQVGLALGGTRRGPAAGDARDGEAAPALAAYAAGQPRPTPGRQWA